MKPIQSRIALISLCLTGLLLLLQFPFFFSPGIVKASSNFIYHAYVFGWILALFWKRFTIPLRTAISFLFVGIYPAMFVSVLLSLPDRKSTRLNSSHRTISYAVFCLKK